MTQLPERPVTVTLRPFAEADRSLLDRWAEQIDSHQYMSRYAPHPEKCVLWCVIRADGKEVGTVGSNQPIPVPLCWAFFSEIRICLGTASEPGQSSLRYSELAMRRPSMSSDSMFAPTTGGRSDATNGAASES
jgi:hypothetical protein